MLHRLSFSLRSCIRAGFEFSRIGRPVSIASVGNLRQSSSRSRSMKRPRMEGGPGGYMGPPPGMPPPGVMDPHAYHAPGAMGGPDFYGGIDRVSFPCVKLRGLPFDVTEDAIRVFLGVEPIDTVLLKRDGRLTGEAFVVLQGPAHVEVALSKSRAYMGRRYIEIFRARKLDYYRAVAAEVADGGLGRDSMREPRGHFMRDEPPARYGGDAPGGGYGGPPAGDAFAARERPPGVDGAGTGTTILKLRGLPYSVSDDDICQWFNDDRALGISPVVKDNVLVVMEGGRPSGIAFVEFPTSQEATQAMAKNRQMLGTRYIEIFPAHRTDLERASTSMAGR